MYKVFYNQRTVLFTENVDNELKKSFDIYYFKNKESLKKKIDEFLNESDSDSLYVIYHDVDFAFKEFCKLYILIEAAGGLVKNLNDKFLFIYRRDKWDLPKGKIDDNEDSKTGAIREVEEECGISNPKIQKELVITYHTYQLEKKDILKKTYWFEMLYEGAELLKPQHEEEITEAVWLNEDDFEKVYVNTFPSIIDVIEKYKLEQ